MNLMVAFKIFWSSSSLYFSSPYKSNWSKLLSSKNRVLYLSSMGLTIAKSTFVGLTKLGYSSLLLLLRCWVVPLLAMDTVWVAAELNDMGRHPTIDI